jgi:hypothetical protein
MDSGTRVVGKPVLDDDVEVNDLLVSSPRNKPRPVCIWAYLADVEVIPKYGGLAIEQCCGDKIGLFATHQTQVEGAI